MKRAKSEMLVLTTIFSLAIASILSTGCEKERPKDAPPEVKSMDSTMVAFEARRQEIQAELKEMSVGDVFTRLQSESLKGLEQYNSPAYKEMISRGRQAAGELKTLIIRADSGSLLPLLALRRMDQEQYSAIDSRKRLGILITSLRNSSYFNVWGIPHLYWEFAAQSIIAEGKPAAEALKPLLNDKRPAPVWGSEEVMEFEKYKYRVCDYAMAMINEINGKKAEIPLKPEDRDIVISGMISGR